MRIAKSSTNISITALTLGTIFVASVFVTNSTAVANVRIAEPVGVKPVRGIDVIVQKEPSNTACTNNQNQ